MTSSKKSPSSLKALRGTQDLIPSKIAKHKWVLDTAYKIAESYGFMEIATPLIELKEVFTKTLGESSDVVHREMYSFQDKSGQDITLRPEGTSGILRAYLSNAFPQRPYSKFFYSGPMFRYERPQKGRQRQFFQFGVEWIEAKHFQSDVEIISLAYDILKKLDLHKKVILDINSIGNKSSRALYRKSLLSFLSSKKAQLSADSLRRLRENPLRILDSKAPQDQDLLRSAPLIYECLTKESLHSFEEIAKSLKKLGIPFKKNPFLVRGLDYYSDCVFEFKIQSHSSGQDAILSGGRYDDLSQTMGGALIPATGWAAGLDRLLLLVDKKIELKRPLVLIPLSADVEPEARWITRILRENEFMIERFYEEKKLNWKMKKAHQIHAKGVLILGEKEKKTNEILFKDMDSGKEQMINLNNLLPELKKIL